MQVPQTIKTVGYKVSSTIGPSWLVGLLALGLLITLIVREVNGRCPACSVCKKCPEIATSVVKTVEKIYEEPVIVPNTN